MSDNFVIFMRITAKSIAFMQIKSMKNMLTYRR